jgi:transporter family-2 protein
LRETGLLAGIVALGVGVIITLQSVLASLVAKGIGRWETAGLFQLGAVLTACLLIVLGMGSFSNLARLSEVPVYALLIGPPLGALIIGGVALVIGRLGAAFGLTVIVAGQLVSALVIDSFGWFGAETVPLTPMRLLAVGLAIAAAALFYL